MSSSAAAAGRRRRSCAAFQPTRRAKVPKVVWPTAHT